MNEHVLVGFGFGPIQSGLFAAEAFKSGRFRRIVIAEVDPTLVEAIRANHGSYVVNVASFTGIKTERIDGVEIYNPAQENDCQELIKALSEATEIVTALPSVNFYDRGEHSAAWLIGQGLKSSSQKAVILYAAENNNHAAEILEEKVKFKQGASKVSVQFLNTVIGKMSQVVTSKDEIDEKNLEPITPSFKRAFLVEEFNRIYVTKCEIPGFTPGINVFIEKEELLPFEEAKLYGHNAIHSLLAYLGARKGYKKMAEIENDTEIMRIAHDAFLDESGCALIKKYSHLNEKLFTPAGYQTFAEDLLERMMNPYLADTIERAARDPQRKLSENDRIFGTMSLCLDHGIEPENMALGAAAGIAYFIKQTGLDPHTSCTKALHRLWQSEDTPYKTQLMKKVKKASRYLQSMEMPNEAIGDTAKQAVH
jgi:mannitol-1-phosphate 5-dehydrogenase